ncbi:MAG: hypothetical protein EAZ57_02205 [Cytophagales bacterium]|nr:MAG: hypothetical protein EAZ67_02380 [Cytophagales bacterium]TAF61931.1 MAG: hypothetical protein EAZ57_02205 [Cytophagales bacterium]
MNKHLHFLFICFLWLGTTELLAQSKMLDSLEQVYSTSKVDTSKFINALRIFESYTSRDTVKREKYYKFSEQHINTLKTKQKQLNIPENHLKAFEASFLRIQAFQQQLTSFDKGLETMKRSLELAKASGLNMAIFDAYSGLALMEEENNNVMKGIEYRLEALKLLETKLKNPRAMGLTCLNLGIGYYMLDKKETGVEYFKRAYYAFEKAKVLRGMSAALNNISTYYADGNQNLDSAFHYCQTSYYIKLKVSDPSALGISLLNLASMHRRKGNLDSAQWYAKKAVENCEKYKRYNWLSGSYQAMAQIMQVRKDYKQAIFWAKKAAARAAEEGDLNSMRSVADTQCEIYVELNDYKNAYEQLFLSSKYKDSLLGDDSKAKMAKLEAQFGFDKQKYQQELAQKEKDLLKEKELAQSVIFRNTAIGVGVFMFIIVMVVIFNQRKIQKINKLLSIKNDEIGKQRDALTEQYAEIQQNREEILTINEQLSGQKNELQAAFYTIEQKNQHILASIQSAQSIQESILPKADRLGLALKDFFILNKPKDVVSGDFYWLGLKNDRTILALLDCTGHGVHGAFITLIAYNLLNKVILSKDFSEPAEILEQLLSEIIKNLKQNENKNNDGFDIGICSIDSNSHALAFSGANSSLFYVHNNELFEARGTHKRIGGVHKSQANKQFISQTIYYDQSTQFFLSSDGYMDQHGGSELKKMGKLKFMDILCECARISDMHKQKEHLESYLTSWTTSIKEQTDDILVIGFKLPE